LRVKLKRVKTLKKIMKKKTIHERLKEKNKRIRIKLKISIYDKKLNT
jgi:hypothetical protein